MKAFRMMLILAFSLLFANVASATKANLTGWVNQRGSTLYITRTSPSGQFEGTFINRAAGFRCQNSPYPVVGWRYGTAITFSVKWQNPQESCNSITAWTGFISGGTMTTLWQLVPNGATSTRQIMQGEDTFRPLAIMKNDSILLKKAK